MSGDPTVRCFLPSRPSLFGLAMWRRNQCLLQKVHDTNTSQKPPTQQSCILLDGSGAADQLNCEETNRLVVDVVNGICRADL